jgi:hypothetical protein
MKIQYDNELHEIETAARMFWYKYALRRTVMLSFVFAILVAVMIIRISMGQGIIAWILMGLSAGFLANLWLKPRRQRKKLLFALDMMYQEKYEAAFCDNAIEIETLINSESEEHEQIEKSRYDLATEELYSVETAELFLLYINRWSTVVFPKRCMSEQEIESLRTYFEEKKI